jgi:NADH:ubiquinone oxidoreductase subunit K
MTADWVFVAIYLILFAIGACRVRTRDGLVVTVASIPMMLAAVVLALLYKTGPEPTENLFLPMVCVYGAALSMALWTTYGRR